MKILKSFPIVILTFVVQQSLAQTPIHLFNGQNLDGWYAYTNESGKVDDASKIFSVENNMIRLYGKNAGYLMSLQTFRDFKIIIKFRWNLDSSFIRKMNNKNSGVMYLVPLATKDTLWPKGIQFQIKEGHTGDFILLKDVTLNVNNKTEGPGKSVVVDRTEDAANPIGEWNVLSITKTNNEIKQELNGKLVNLGRDPSVSEGRVLLMYEGFPIDFKQIEIEKL